MLEEFRLHFTLSDAVDAPERLAAKIAEDFARRVPDPNFAVDALALFVQAEPGGEFRAARRFRLAKSGGSA